MSTIAEGCWHCHSQFVRPVSNESSRYGPVSLAVGVSERTELSAALRDASCWAGFVALSRRHTNDWHAAHFWDPAMVVPTSVMPRFPWFFDENKQPNDRG